jgi:trans-aconitate methyltransferase
VFWACHLARLHDNAVICDAGCGPGGDIATLLRAQPSAHVVGVDSCADFVATAQARYAGQNRVEVFEGDLAKLPRRPFDMIWCAGALYFLGLRDGLETLRQALTPSGVIAFSEPCYFTDTPSEPAHAFWEGYPTRSAEAILHELRGAGFEVLGHRKVPDAGWEAYFGPLEERVAALRPTADARLTEMLDSALQEAATWRSVREETGYLLIVARKT